MNIYISKEEREREKERFNSCNFLRLYNMIISFMIMNSNCVTKVLVFYILYIFCIS